MAGKNKIAPGTVSKILWHFTGGPIWSIRTQRQSDKLKSSANAFENLNSILRTKTLRLGTYKEVVKVILAKATKYNRDTKKIKVEKNVPVTIESSSVCCLSDIPAPHLHYHAQRYGKFAIGFHRDAITQAGFNPVFYTLEDTPIIRSIYEGFSSLEFSNPDMIRWSIDSIDSQVSDVEFDEIDISSDLEDIGNEIAMIEDSISDVKQSLEDFIAFVKTFNRKEFGTIYCEREWRSTKQYNFGVDDIAMIVLPKTIRGTQYFKKFVEKVAPKLKIPRRIPIIPWDDLVEY